jgi:hypothetical protein
MGSVGFGKLINVSLEQTVSQEAVDAAAGNDVNGNAITWGGAAVNAKFRHYIRFGCNSIVRLEGGSIGLPIF